MAGRKMTYGAKDDYDSRPGLKKLGALERRASSAKSARLANDRRPAADLARTFVFNSPGRASIAPFKRGKDDPMRIAAEAIYNAYLVTPPAPRDQNGRRAISTIELSIEAALDKLGDEFVEANTEAVLAAVDHAKGVTDENNKKRQGAYTWGFNAAKAAEARAKKEAEAKEAVTV